MNKLIIFVLVAATFTLTSCGFTGFTTASDYGNERMTQSYDPYFYGPGIYGADRYGYGRQNRYNYGRPNRYDYRSFDRFGNGYDRYNPYTNRRRPTVIYRSAPTPSPAPATRIRPINPRTDRWNSKEQKRDDNR